jgi:hypothetical protein
VCGLSPAAATTSMSVGRHRDDLAHPLFAVYGLNRAPAAGQANIAGLAHPMPSLECAGAPREPGSAMKRVGILQSNYIPWKGYFDIIHDVDLFVFHDDLQYTKNDWRNRNRIKTQAGERWLTIPVGTSEHRRICDVRLPHPSWAIDHWRRIQAAYERAPFFAEYRDYLDALYRGTTWTWLSEMNQAFIVGISRDLLGIQTTFCTSTELHLTRTKGERVLELLEKTGAETYVSGPAARAYITDEEFTKAGIQVIWKDYAGYPEYAQLHPPFSHRVTILDLLFHTGPEAGRHIWGWRGTSAPGVTT